jgi:hypothetical protein
MGIGREGQPRYLPPPRYLGKVKTMSYRKYSKYL